MEPRGALLAVLCLLALPPASPQPRSFKHVAPRVGARFFMRLNTKVNVVPYTAVFAYASGFRLNYDIRPTASVHLARASLHESIAAALYRYGLEGRDCILRAFCELAEIQSHSDVISNILKVIFKSDEEPSCPGEFACPLSLVSLPYLLYGAHTTS